MADLGAGFEARLYACGCAEASSLHIWAMVDPMAFWQDWVLCRLGGQSVEHLKQDPRRNGSAVYQAHDETAWRLACERLMTTNRQLGEVVAGFTDQELEAA